MSDACPRCGLDFTQPLPAALRVGLRARKLRTAAGITMEGMMRALGHKNHSWYSQFEAGLHDPRLETLEKVSRALGVSLTELVQP